MIEREFSALLTKCSLHGIMIKTPTMSMAASTQRRYRSNHIAVLWCIRTCSALTFGRWLLLLQTAGMHEESTPETFQQEAKEKVSERLRYKAPCHLVDERESCGP